MLQRWMELILKLRSVDALASGAGTSWIPTLDHEAGNNAVEDDIIVLVCSSERCKVLGCLLRLVCQ